MSPFRIEVSDLLAHPGARREVQVEGTLDDFGTPVARINSPVRLELVLQRVPDGIVVRGEVHARWDAECSTCLRDLSADLVVGVAELFEPDPVEDTYPLDGHELDLEQLVRDSLLLELPLAPVCDQTDCAPVAIAEVHLSDADAEIDEAAPAVDPRWAALADLEL